MWLTHKEFHELLERLTKMDQDVQALVNDVATLKTSNDNLTTQVNDLVAAFKAAGGLTAADKQALEQAATDVQGVQANLDSIVSTIQGLNLTPPATG